MLYKNKVHKLKDTSPMNILSKFSQDVFLKNTGPLGLTSFHTHANTQTKTQCNKDPRHSSSPYLTKKNKNKISVSISNDINIQIPRCLMKYDSHHIDQSDIGKEPNEKLNKIKKEMMVMFTKNKRGKDKTSSLKSRSFRRSANLNEKMSEEVNKIKHSTSKNKAEHKSKTIRFVEIKRLLEQPYREIAYSVKGTVTGKGKGDKPTMILMKSIRSNDFPGHKRVLSEIDQKDIENFSQEFTSIMSNYKGNINFNVNTTNTNTNTNTKTRNRPLESYQDSNWRKRAFTTVYNYNTLLSF